jgi:nucleotide-binding universal stress UspA family protein
VFPASAVAREVESRAEARSLVAAGVRRLRKAGVAASGTVLSRPARSSADQLLEAIAAFEADLVITRCEGVRRWQTVLGGGVARQLLRRARCPVLCLPPGLEALDLRRVAAAWDGSPSARQALRLAERLAAVHGSRVSLLHVSPEARESLDLGSGGLSVGLLAPGADGLAETLNRAAAARGAGLVLVGSHARGLLGAAVLGSVAYRLLELSERPVLVACGS